MNIETTAEPIREGLPSLPKGKMLSGMDMESLHVLYTAGQMQDYARAALAARSAAPSVSAPSDEPVAWAIYAENGNCRIWHGNAESAKKWARLNGDAPITPLYARPAPSAPTDEENYDALRAAIIAELSTHRMVHLYEMEDDGPGAKYPLLDQLSLEGGTIGNGLDEIEAIADAVLDVVAARAAAPVSGQGVSLGDDAGIAIFYPNFGGNTYPTHTVIQAGEAANAYIDSRPRSEDSRAKVLEEAAQACDSRAENFQTSMTNAIHGSTAELARALRNEASSCALAIRALASTPPKADNIICASLGKLLMAGVKPLPKADNE